MFSINTMLSTFISQHPSVTDFQHPFLPPCICSKFEKFENLNIYSASMSNPLYTPTFAVCHLTPEWGEKGADTFPTLSWETGVAAVLITNSTMSKQPPYGVIYRGQTGHFDSQGIHMTTAGITPAPGQLWLPQTPRRGLVQTQTAGVAYKAWE